MDPQNRQCEEAYGPPRLPGVRIIQVMRYGGVGAMVLDRISRLLKAQDMAWPKYPSPQASKRMIARRNKPRNIPKLPGSAGLDGGHHGIMSPSARITN